MSKREVQLSQDLMELQSRYNGLIFEKNVCADLLKMRDVEIDSLRNHIAKLEETVSILKSLSKKDTVSVTKKYAAKNK